METVYKHYITLNGNVIIGSFSNAFKTPTANDTYYRDSDDRHFNLKFFDNDGIHDLKFVDGEIVQRTAVDKKAEILTRLKAIKKAELRNKIREQLVEGDATFISKSSEIDAATSKTALNSISI